jgi:predicted ArsR family transcriptional regulator
MKPSTLSERFFESTRGRIVKLLRGTTGTVNELAERLGLTDNAVRAQLLTLERDGLVRQTGMQKGTRKPHFAYELTADAEQLFPKVYDALLNQLITVLKARLTPGALKDALREVGRSLAAKHRATPGSESREARVEQALEVLTVMGGAPRFEFERDRLVIRSSACPLSGAVAEHPEVCELAEALVEEIIGAPVNERCDRSASPRCCFELARAG